MRKVILLLVICFGTFSYQANAQVPQPDAEVKETIPFKDRIFTGGNLGVRFGTFTLIDVSPLIGVRVTDKFSVGLQATYQYLRTTVRYQSGTESYSTSIYGGAAFTRFFVTNEIFLHSEYQLLNMNVYDNLLFDFRRATVPFFYVGAGYRSQIGSNAWVSLYLLYDLIGDRLSPYPRFIPRGGITIGF